jgi:subtilase family serine protease
MEHNCYATSGENISIGITEGYGKIEVPGGLTEFAEVEGKPRRPHTTPELSDSRL